MANITGTDKAEVLNGTENNDVIVGLDGNDTLNGKGGKDVLVGNRGADKHNGGHGDDIIVWNNGDGSDTNDGGSGKDTQVVNGANAAGDAFEVRTGGNDFLFDRVNLVPFKLNDKNIEKLEVNGGGGHDCLKVFDLAGTDLKEIHFKGGAGNDSLDASATSVPVKAWGGDGNDKLLGGSGNDELNGDAGNDLLIGNRGSDKHNGGHGNDTIVWNNGDGSDFNDGGSGHDTQVVNGANAAGDEFVVTANGPGFLFDRVNLVPFKLTDKNIEKLDVNGQGGDDKLTIKDMSGTSLKEASFHGGAGRDTLDASDTNIPVKAWGGDGHDKLFGGSANDVLNGDAGDDLLIGNRGSDKHNGGHGNDTIVWNNGDGSDFNDGGSGKDTQVVNGANAAGDEFVVKASGGGFVFDRVNLVPFKLTDKNIEILDVNGQGGDDKLVVGDLHGSGLQKIFFDGGDGKDFLDASKSHIPVEASGGKGHDTLIGGSANDVLRGDDGNDVLRGGRGDDKIFGGHGNDSLFGGSGKDTLTGGSGSDHFFVDHSDVITDFQDGIDSRTFIV